MGKSKKIGDTSTSASIRDETMELLPMPPRKRLRRAQKIYPPQQKSKSDNDPWWNQIQIGDEPSGSFGTWLEMNNRSTGFDELDRENEAFSMRTTSVSTISSEASDITF